MRRLSSRICLSDESIIGCINILRPAFTQTSAAVFSTHVYSNFVSSAGSSRSGYSLWNAARKTGFWRSDVLVIPINLKEQNHWVAATVYLKEGKIELFDSLAYYTGCDRISKVRVSKSIYSLLPIRLKQNVKELVYKLFELAVQYKSGEEPGLKELDQGSKWTTVKLLVRLIKLLPSARSNEAYTQDEAVQHNGYDCGVWVLSQIIANLSGSRLVIANKHDIDDMRTFLKEQYKASLRPNA